MIKNIYTAGIPVRNQDKAIEFYTTKLGLKVACDEPMCKEDKTCQRWIEIEIPGAETKIALFTPEGQEDRIGTFSNICFSTDDIKKTVDELKAKGVEFAQEITEMHWGKMAMFKDLDNNTFCLAEGND